MIERDFVVVGLAGMGVVSMLCGFMLGYYQGKSAGIRLAYRLWIENGSPAPEPKGARNARG